MTVATESLQSAVDGKAVKISENYSRVEISIVANNKLYVIGGYVDEYYLDTIQYAVFEPYSSNNLSYEPGLRSGDIIGIICGCIVLVCCCVIILVFIYLKPNQEKQEKTAEDRGQSLTESDISERGEEDRGTPSSHCTPPGNVDGKNLKYTTNAPPYMTELKQQIELHYIQVIEPSAPEEDVNEHASHGIHVVDTRRETDEDKVFQKTASFEQEEGDEGRGEQIEIINDLDMNGRELLIHWNLGKYAKAMIDEQEWNDPLEWKYFTEETLKNDIGFKDTQIRKFMDKYKDWLKRKNQ